MLASVFGEPALVVFAWQDAMRSTSDLRSPSENGRMPCFA
jgi:hypothetical protein